MNGIHRRRKKNYNKVSTKNGSFNFFKILTSVIQLPTLILEFREFRVLNNVATEKQT